MMSRWLRAGPIAVITLTLIASTACSSSAGSWSGPEQLPLSGPESELVGSISDVACPADESCVATGLAAGSNGYFPAVTAQSNGKWQALQRLGNTNIGDSVTTLACSSPGNCLAGGYFLTPEQRNGLPPRHGLLASQVNGVWQGAQSVFGMESFQPFDGASVDRVSCPSDGNCVAIGTFSYRSARYPSSSFPSSQGFLAEQVGGEWKRASPIPGLEALNSDEYVTLDSLDCFDEKTCVATGTFASNVVCLTDNSCYTTTEGSYRDGRGLRQAFIVERVNGRWLEAVPVPGMAELNSTDATLTSVSCTTAMDCIGVGWFSFDDTTTQGFFVQKENNTWGEATLFPGLVDFAQEGDARVRAVDCSSPGFCVAGGETDSTEGFQALVIEQVEGNWLPPQLLPEVVKVTDGSAPISGAGVTSVSCTSQLGCVVGGRIGEPCFCGFVASYINQEWTAVRALKLQPPVNITDCSEDGYCLAAGERFEASPAFMSTRLK